jgi:hypothetical protein
MGPGPGHLIAHQEMAANYATNFSMLIFAAQIKTEQKA